MKTLENYRTKRAVAHSISRPAFVGLISEEDFYRPELYGFEVDMTGRALLPEFGSVRVSADLPSLKSFS